MNDVKIGKFICDMRKEKGLTQRELANVISVTDKAISKWETGKGYPDISLLIPLSNALGVSVNELLSGEKINNESECNDDLNLTIKLSLLSQKKIEKKIIYIVSSFVLVTLLLLYLSGSLSSVGVLVMLVILILLMGFKVKRNKSFLNIVFLFYVFIYTFYSFFTYTGSVRLEVMLMGHPIKAYTSSLKVNTFRSSNREKYYEVLSDIQVTSGDMGLIKCESFYGFKVSSYYGF